MLIGRIRKNVRADLESPPELRQFGTGWLSGVAALVTSVGGLFLVLCLRYPSLLTVPPLRSFYLNAWFRLALHFLLIVAFMLSILSLMLRVNKVLGFTAMSAVLLATVIGGLRVESHGELTTGVFLGLDWFVLNVIFTGFLFVPVERLFPHRKGQSLFRNEWREDLFYFLVSSLLIQLMTFLSMAPAIALAAHTSWTTFRGWVASQQVVIQVVEIMFLTDLVQYWVHRAFHRVPFLWGFHSIHHSATSMDWMAAARLHLFENIAIRATTVIPMYLVGFSAAALHAYILLVYIHTSFVHGNINWNLDQVGRFLVTPRYHHWHHGIDKEAVDVNFAIHFPILDHLFGTHHFPPHEWPEGYGINNQSMPRSYWRQLFYPFSRK